MPEINVTFADLTLASPFIGSQLDPALIPEAEETDSSAVLLPPLTEKGLSHSLDTDEILPNNDLGIARDSAEWLLREMNAETYLDLVQDTTKKSAVPVIASLSFSHRGNWLRYARRVTQAGADAVELRIMDHLTNERSDLIEKRAIRIVSLVADALDEPVIVRLRSCVTGPLAFAQALCDAGAKAIVVESPRITKISDTGIHREPGSPAVAVETIRRLYRRVSAHLAVDVGPADIDTVTGAVLAGATAVIHVPRPEKRALSGGLESWMGKKQHETIFDFRGSLSESRLSASVIEE